MNLMSILLIALHVIKEMLQYYICIVSLSLFVKEINSFGNQNSNINSKSPTLLQVQRQQSYQHSLENIMSANQFNQQRIVVPNKHFDSNMNEVSHQIGTRLKEDIVGSLNLDSGKIFNGEQPSLVSISEERPIDKLSTEVADKIQEHRLSLTNLENIQPITLKKDDQMNEDENQFVNHEQKILFTGFIESIVNFFKGIYDVSGPAQPNLDPITTLDNNLNNTQTPMYSQTKGVSSIQIHHIATEKYSEQNIQILQNNMRGMKKKRRKMQFIITVFLFGIIGIILIKINQSKQKISQAKYIWRSLASKLPSNDEGEEI